MPSFIVDFGLWSNPLGAAKLHKTQHKEGILEKLIIAGHIKWLVYMIW